jgi:branched-chain amino acid transport system ATP-binding protein
MNSSTAVTPISTSPLCVRNLCASYERVEALHDVSIQLESGETVAVLGANGAGKSTLMRAVAGLVTCRGEVHLGGCDLTRMRAHERACRGVAFVPEIRGNIFPALSVRENLDVALRQLSSADANSLDIDIHRLFPILRERAEAPAGMLSGGEQQMLAVALALGRRPVVLMLDEPTQGLAPAVYEVLQSALRSLKERGMSILLSEQNVAFAARCADRFIVLAAGRVTLTGSAEEMLHPVRVMAAYMGSKIEESKVYE